MNAFIQKHLKLVFALSISLPIIAVIAFLITSSQQEEKKMGELRTRFANWEKINGSSASFSVLFPSTPESQILKHPLPDDQGTAVQEILTASSDGQTYSISAFVYPFTIETKDKDKLSDFLNEALDGVLGSLPEAKLVSKKIDPLVGDNILEFVIFDESNNTYSKGRLVLTEDTLYQMWTDSKNKDWTDEEVYFVKSFEIGKK